MRIAIPVEDGLLCRHFGHCASFVFIDADGQTKQIISTTSEAAPEHQHGILPPWLKERGVTHVIAGGLGQHARELLSSMSIEVLSGAPSESPSELVVKYLNGSLVSVEQVCEHNCKH